MNKTRIFTQKALQKLGYHVTSVKNTLDYKRAEILTSLGITIVFDVGANLGQFAHIVRTSGYSGNIVSFEPMASIYQQLSESVEDDPNHICKQLALGDSEQTASINVMQQHASSSLLEPNPRIVTQAELARPMAWEEVLVTRLDTIISDVSHSKDRIYLKIDTQGYEDRVLKGATNSFRQIYAIEIELSLAEVYKGQSTLPSIWITLEQLGYSPIWIERGYLDPVTGYMLQCDAIFLKS
jgi:FkbM family methyltransferase